MKSEWRRLLSERAPRYESYPSARCFDRAVTADDYADRLSGVELYEPLSIYVHVPFCRNPCWCCGSDVRIENGYRGALRYVSAVQKEMRLVGARLNGAGTTQSVHLGGGAPNYLLIDEIAEILKTIELEFGLTDNARLAIELHPALLREDDVSRIAALGFRRMTVGVYDFDPAVQAAINCVQSSELIDRVVAEMRSAGVPDVSFDLLYGLPKQTFQSFTASLEKTIALSPDQVSVLGYAHLPAAIARQQLIDPQRLPGPELRADLALLADATLIAAGYRRIGVGHYAKAGNALAKAARERRLKRNLQGFTEDAGTTVLAFGVSAVSSIAGLHVQNEKGVAAYYEKISANVLATAIGVESSAVEAIIGAAINDLFCYGAANIAPLLMVLQAFEAAAICRRLESLEKEGIIDWQGDVIRIIDDARLLSWAVAAAIDPYAAPTYSGATAALAPAH